jgi:hypothetical protein
LTITEKFKKYKKTFSLTEIAVWALEDLFNMYGAGKVTISKRFGTKKKNLDNPRFNLVMQGVWKIYLRNGN